MSLARLIESHWYAPRPWLSVLLAPLAGLFALLSAGRRQLFRLGLKTTERLPVPVVVIGNINVGGVGKTPLTRHLLEALTARGLRPAVVSRGYGGRAASPRLVTPASTAAEVGDEPLLLAAAGCPVAVGRDRVAAARLLLQRHPDTDLILTDDGLQHYRLQRDVEIVVLDAERGVGNGRLLPAGPLREAVSRLESVDAVVVNGGTRPDLVPAGTPAFTMTLQPGRFWRVGHPADTRAAADFAGQDLAALAGIGHPERFFATVAGLGLACRQYPFPDHHAFVAADIPAADAVLVTEKDAVKLTQCNSDKLWALPVTAQVEPDLAGWLLHTLKDSIHGHEAP